MDIRNIPSARSGFVDASQSAVVSPCRSIVLGSWLAERQQVIGSTTVLYSTVVLYYCTVTKKTHEAAGVFLGLPVAL